MRNGGYDSDHVVPTYTLPLVSLAPPSLAHHLHLAQSAAGCFPPSLSVSPTAMTIYNMTSGPPGPSTPMRAITSTLAARSAPRIPPASQTYEPLVKSILGRRLIYNILAPSLAYSWVLANLWSKWSQGGPSQLGLWRSFVDCVKLLTLLHAVAIWLLGVVPALVLRNRFLAGKFCLHRAGGGGGAHSVTRGGIHLARVAADWHHAQFVLNAAKDAFLPEPGLSGRLHQGFMLARHLVSLANDGQRYEPTESV